MTSRQSDQPPTVQQMQSHLARSLSFDQLAAISVWLGLESIERESDEIFALGKDAVVLAELSRSRSTPMRQGDDSA